MTDQRMLWLLAYIALLLSAAMAFDIATTGRPFG